MVKFRVTLEKADLEVLFQQADKIKRQAIPAKKFTDYLVNETKQQFETETDPSGNRWKALKASTLKQKRGDKIGTETETMRRSLYGRLSKSGRGEIGFKVPYAQHFTKDRPLLGVTPEREKEGLAIFEDHYQKQLNK